MMMNDDRSLAKRTVNALMRTIATLLLALTSAACNTSSSGNPDVGTPDADFTQSATEGGPGLVVRFDDESSGEVDAFEWDFGAAGKSQERNPTVRFDEVGVYTVELTVSGPEGRSRIEKPALIEIFEAGDAGVASFTANHRTGGPGLSVRFENTSIGDLTSHTWDFGDDGIAPSTERSPTVVFEEVGSYTITLNVVGSAGAGVAVMSNYIVVSEPEATDFVDFTANRTSGGPGMMVQLSDTSGGTSTSWNWEIRDTDEILQDSSSEMTPSFVFDNVGEYSVTLEVDGDRGEGIATRTGYITVLAPSESGLADFTVNATQGVAVATFDFSDTSTVAPTSWSWEVRDALDALVASSSIQNPSFTLTTPGIYDVSLSITSPGGDSTLERPGYLRVFGAPTAAFECTPATPAFSPVERTCTHTATDAQVLEWNFGDGTGCYFRLDAEFDYVPGTWDDECDSEHPVHEYSVPAGATAAVEHTIELTAIGLGGSDSASQVVSTAPLVISPNVASGTGSAPLDVRFRAETNGVAVITGRYFWEVNPQIDGSFGASRHDTTLNRTGTYTVSLIVHQENPFAIVTTEIEYVVGHAAPQAAFGSEGSAGAGPLSVEFVDESTGDIRAWLWEFGDSADTKCFFTEDPEISAPDDEPPCDSFEPTFEYTEVGTYDVTLTVYGPENEGDTALVTSEVTNSREVRVVIADPSFEAQGTNAQIGGAWTHLRPDSPTQAATHVALGSDEPGAVTDRAMPTDGTRWAIIDGTGTDGADPIEETENGIEQTFLLQAGRPVLEFDYAFLYSEPPNGAFLDAMVATVSDGTDVVVIPTSAADTRTPYAGESLLFASEDPLLRVTPVMTASLNLEAAFPTADEFTEFTLTIRVANANNDGRSPYGYVDNVRFSRAASDTLPARFELDTDPVYVGAPAQFFDLTCSDEADACAVPTSWFWDFDTHGLATPPEASGSDEQHPAYIFEAPGDYTVELTTRRADLEDTAFLVVTVIADPIANFEVASAEPYEVGTPIAFTNTSVVDPLDPVVMWEWDFGRFALSEDENPAPVIFPAPGLVDVSLRLTTESGVVSESAMQIEIIVAP